MVPSNSTTVQVLRLATYVDRLDTDLEEVELQELADTMDDILYGQKAWVLLEPMRWLNPAFHAWYFGQAIKFNKALLWAGLSICFHDADFASKIVERMQ